MRVIRSAMVGVLLLALTLPAFADLMTYGQYKRTLAAHNGAPPPYLHGYLDGLMHGYLAASVNLRLQGNESLICVPDNLLVDWETAVVAIEGFSKFIKIKDDADMPNTVLFALRYTFPCH